MSLGHGASVVRKGLVFQYDMGNVKKSYKGAPFTNITKPIYHSNYGSVASNVYGVGGTEYVNIPEVGRTLVKYNDFYNHYTQYTPNSGSCCPAPINYGLGVPISPSTVYTYMILYKTESGYTHPNFMYRYEFNSSSAYLTEQGVHSTNRRVHLGNDWYYAWGTFTTQATAAKANFHLFYYRYSTTPDKISIAKAMVVAGDYSGLHPKYWIEPETTRSNTEAILDLTGNNTITASNLSYNADGTFEFDGADDLIDINYGASINPTTTSITVCAWVKSDTTSGNRMWVDVGSNGTNQRFYSGLSCAAGGHGFGSQGGTWGSGSTPNDTNWHFQTIVMNSTNNTAYVYDNGELLLTRAYTSYTFAGDLNFGGRIGYPWLGKISSVQVYEKALTTQEIQQNFNASRDRYGI